MKMLCKVTEFSLQKISTVFQNISKLSKIFADFIETCPKSSVKFIRIFQNFYKYLSKFIQKYFTKFIQIFPKILLIPKIFIKVF